MDISPSPFRRIPATVWLFCLTFAIRFFALSRLAASPYFLPDFGDMQFYSNWALRIAHGHFSTGESFYGLPGYAYLLALIYSIAGFDPFLVGVLQSALEGITAVLLYRVAGNLFEQAGAGAAKAKWIGVLAGLGWAIFQPAQAFSIILMPTSWLILAFWGCLYWVLKTRSNSTWRPWAGMGALIGATAMMIATILFLLPLVFAAIAFQVHGIARKIVAAAIVVMAAFAGMSPCWIHNRFVAHEPVLLSAHSGLNFYIGNNETSNGYPKMPPGMRASQQNMLGDSIVLAQKAAGHKLKHYEVSQYWSEKANAFIHNHFRDWLGLMGLKFRNFWNAYQYDDLSLISHFAQDGIILPGLRFGFVAALGIAGMVVGGFKHPRVRWVIAAVLLHMGALMSVFITERYRLAAVPGLCLLAAIFAVELWESLVAGRWKAATGMCLLATGAALFVSLPQLDRNLWWLDFYNTGVRATEMGELDKAQRNLEAAYAYVPNNAETNFCLGNLWLAKKEIPRAKQFYMRALQADPTHAKAWNNLGVLAIGEKRWALADKLLARSLSSEPEDAKTHFLAAQTKLKLGDIPGAEREIKAAVELRPEEKLFKALELEVEKQRAGN